MKILLIDDDSVFRNYLRVRFKHEDWECLEADDLEQGRTLILEQKPQVLVIDVYLDEECGLNIVPEIRSNPDRYGTPLILAVSGGIQDERVTASGFLEQFQIDRYFEKPFQATELIEWIRKNVRMA